jgi:hypothetical protein
MSALSCHSHGDISGVTIARITDARASDVPRLVDGVAFPHKHCARFVHAHAHELREGVHLGRVEVLLTHTTTAHR